MISGDFEPGRGSATGPPRTERRLAAILGADIRGYSTLMAEAEEQTHRRVGVAMDRIRREIEKSHGRIFTFAGDGLMAEFPSAVEALKCALRIQADSAKREADVPAARRIDFRIGLNSGEIITQKGRTGGHTVNVAARLEAIAEPGGICLSAAVFEQVRRIVVAAYEPAGARKLKNIRDPVAIYRIPPGACRNWAGMPALPRAAVTAPDPDPGAGAGEYRASLAVLPFRTLQQDQSDAYFAEGMVEDIIRALGGLKDLLVIARTSTQMFAGAPLDLRRIAHELDVRYVVHGSVRRGGERLRIGVELSEAPTGHVIWADRFDGGIADLFELQDRISIRVATMIAPHLRERELTRAMRKRPENMTAYDLTLQALHRMHHLDRESFQQARSLLLQAIAVDPGHAPAYSQLASLHLRLIAQGWTNDVAADQTAASNAAEAAIERDRNDALGLTIFGHSRAYLLRDFHTANEFLDRAIAVGPSCAWAWGYSSNTRGYLGDYDEAVARAEHAVRLSPIGADSYYFEHHLSQAYYLSGRFADAAGWGRLSASRVDRNLSNLRCLIVSLVALGEMTEAQQFAQRLLAVSPGYTVSTFRARTPLVGDIGDLFARRLRLAGIPD
jgi:adenylate cyclase